MSYASAGSVALASASASGVIVEMNVTDRSKFELTFPVNSTASNAWTKFIDLDNDMDTGANWSVKNKNKEFRFHLYNYSGSGSALVDEDRTWPGDIGNRTNGMSFISYGLKVSTSNLKPVRLSSGYNGWVRISLEARDANGSILTNDAMLTSQTTYTKLSVEEGWYENSGADITVGDRGTAVPEPSSFAYLGLLAAGAGGVFALKKFRKQQLIEEAKA